MVWRTYIPTRFNDGSPVSQAEIQEILQSIAAKYGGVTAKEGAKGIWIDTDDGTTYHDDNIEVEVACENDRYAEVEATITEIGRRLKQKAMFVEFRYLDGPRVVRTV